MENENLWDLDMFVERAQKLQDLKRQIDSFGQEKFCVEEECQACDDKDSCESIKNGIITNLQSLSHQLYNIPAEMYNAQSERFGPFPADSKLPERFELYEIFEDGLGGLSGALISLMGFGIGGGERNLGVIEIEVCECDDCTGDSKPIPEGSFWEKLKNT